MIIVDEIMEKWKSWMLDGNREPNAVLIPAKQYHQFTEWLLWQSASTLQQHPPKFNGMDVLFTKDYDEIKVGILI